MTDTTKDAALRLCEEVIAERDALRSHMMTLMDVAAEGLRLPQFRTYDYGPRCEMAVKQARALLADRRTAGGNP